MTSDTERIASAAMRVGGLIVSMPQPARHHNILWELDRLGMDPFIKPIDQGFITDSGRFVERAEACVIAAKADQIRHKTGPADELFSECMW